MKTNISQNVSLLSILLLGVVLFASSANAADPMTTNPGSTVNFVVFSNTGAADNMTITDVDAIGDSHIVSADGIGFGLIGAHNTISRSSLVTETTDAADDSNHSCSLSKTDHVCGQ